MTGLKPCPFCGCDLLVLHADRLDRSYIRCVCGASMSTDCSGCSDPPIEMLVDALISMWNRRADHE